MNEYIIRETGYPGTLKQEIVGELVRCKDCKHRQKLRECPMYHLNYERYEWQLDDDCDDYTKDYGFCDRGERKQE